MTLRTHAARRAARRRHALWIAPGIGAWRALRVARRIDTVTLAVAAGLRPSEVYDIERGARDRAACDRYVATVLRLTRSA